MKADEGNVIELADEPQSEEVKGLTVWSPSQLLAYEVPPDHYVLGPYLASGELALMVGQGGLGKSRLATWLAACQITGQSFLGLDVSRPARRWLMIGNENSIVRQREDLRRMMTNFDEEQRRQIENHLRVHVLHRLEDAFLDLSDLQAVARIRETLRAEGPGVVVFDPWGALTPDEDRTFETRETLKVLARLVRETVPNAAVLILAHARTGSGNIRQGIGWDQANFLKGSKALFSTARMVMNLMPGDPEDATRLVVSCAKCNNGRKFSTRGVVLDQERFCYELDTEFDLETWIGDLDGKRSASSVSLGDVFAVVREACPMPGDCIKRAEIVRIVQQDTAASERTIGAKLTKLVREHYLRKIGERKGYALGSKPWPR